MKREQKAYWYVAVVGNRSCRARVLRFKYAGSSAAAHSMLTAAGWQIYRVARESEVSVYDLKAEAKAGERRALEDVDDWSTHLWAPCDTDVLENWIAYYSDPRNPKATDWDAQCAVFQKAQQVARVALGGVRRHWQQQQTVREP